MSEKSYNVLAIDDEQDVLDSLKNIARNHKIKLIGAKSLEEARGAITMQKENFFHGFILDVVCNLTKDQTAPKADFITDALDYLKKNFTVHPRYIITGHSDHYEGFQTYHSEEKIVEKADSDALNEMFVDMRVKIESLRENKIIKKYFEVFEIFDQDLLDTDIKGELLETLKQMDNHNLTTIKDNLARIRRIYEAVYISISKRREDIIPVNLLRGDKGELKASAITYHLKQNHYATGLVVEFLYKIWNVASDNGAHTPYQRPDYMPTKYTVQSITYALLDILLWMKSLLT
jgi:RecG-like helicase